MAPSSVLPPVKRFKNFKYIETFGKGNFGNVYHVIDESGNEYAAKVTKINPNKKSRETEILEIVKGIQCPYLVKFKDTFTDSSKGVNLNCFLFECLLGGEITTLLKEHFALSID
jgi:serine/threonine protein kinase